jgi:hypothetical protein
MKYLKLFENFNVDNVVEIKDYIEQVLMEIPEYEYEILFFDKPIYQFNIKIKSKSEFKTEDVSHIFRHLDNYMRGFGFRNPDPNPEVLASGITDPMTFQLVGRKFDLFIRYLKKI